MAKGNVLKYWENGVLKSVATGGGGGGGINDEVIANDSTWSSGKNAQSFASALTGKVLSATVAADDVSPLPHAVSCRAQSRNIIDFGPFPTNKDYAADKFDVVKRLHPGIWVLRLIGAETGEEFREGTDYVTELRDKNYNSVIKNMGKGALINQADLDRIAELFIYFNSAAFASGGTGDSYFNLQFEEVPALPAGPLTYTPYVPTLTAVTVSRQRPDGTDKQDYNPAEDGTVTGMTSLAPAMTILTDNPGVTLEVSYNRDPGIIIDKLAARVAALENKAEPLI